MFSTTVLLHPSVLTRLCVFSMHNHIVTHFFLFFFLQSVCTEVGMFALRERRVHVTQEDFEMAVAKVMKKETEKNMSLHKLWK